MRSLLVVVSSLILFGSASAGPVYDKSAPDVAVEVKVNADLLRLAKERGLDLGLLLESNMVAALGEGASRPASHAQVLTGAFESLNAAIFAPLTLDTSASPQQVKAACGKILDDVQQLIAHSKTRASLPEPSSIEELIALNQQRERSFHALNAKTKQQSQRIKAVGKMLDAQCPELNQLKATMNSAIKTALAPYSPRAWCQSMMRKPQSAWSMQDANRFVQLCRGVKAN